ncbi:MAG: hypothetical protein GXY51_12700 [Bacteroidetes bacterium]|nr:hypothetical protein [Bacteroidota bacterium]
MISVINLLNQKESQLAAYSQYDFLNEIDQLKLTKETVVDPLINELNSKMIEIDEINIANETHFFLYKKLDWDTEYFGFPVYSIKMVLYNHNDLQVLNKAINEFIKHKIKPGEYWFTNVPSDEILIVQALCNTLFKLVETRLGFYLGSISDFESEHYPVRMAIIEDADDLRKVSMKMRNRYDRVHADPAFSTEQADKYLGKFVEESLKGFADFVLVPDIGDIRPFGFLAWKKPVEVLGKRISKIVLTAVDNSIQRGWLFKLLTEMKHLAKGLGTDYITTITQAPNKPAIHIYQKAGFVLKSVTHIFSIKLS